MRMPEVQRSRRSSADARAGATACATHRTDAVFIFVQQQRRFLSALAGHTLVEQQLAPWGELSRMKRSGGRNAPTLI
jgi:hypothetical protein